MALRGLKVIEMAGLAPAPMAGMILADFGATVVRIDKKHAPLMDYLTRDKRSLVVDLRQPEGVKVVRKLCHAADVLIEPYRPGVMERMGLGPDELLKINPRLIYSRLTGFGQSDKLSTIVDIACTAPKMFDPPKSTILDLCPLALKAGHDINYLAISGVLSMFGRHDEKPLPPINLLADFAGGGVMCALGILAALVERNVSQKGQVVDVAMVEGAAYIGSFLHASKRIGIWRGKRGFNLLDGGAPFYEVYTTLDGRYMSVGAIEDKFYKSLLDGLGFTEDDLPTQMDSDKWPEMKEKFAKVFATKTQQEWTEIFSNRDACVEPVLGLDDAPNHPHNIHRKVFQQPTEDQATQVCPAPKLSRTPGELPVVIKDLHPGEHTIEVLLEAGYPHKEIEQLMTDGVVVQYKEDSKL